MEGRVSRNEIDLDTSGIIFPIVLGVEIRILNISLLSCKFIKIQWRWMKIYKPFSLWINSSFSRSQSSFEWINFIHVPGKFLTKNLLNFRTGCWNPASFVHFRTYFSQIVLYISLLHFKVQGRILFILKI